MSQITDIGQNVNVALVVENFGPIAEARIDLRPLTVFVGNISRNNVFNLPCL